MYAVIDQQGEAIAQNLTAIEAARTILTHDGATYQIRFELGGWVLWVKPLNGEWRAHVHGSPHSMFVDAEAEIMAAIIRTANTSHGWTCEAIPQKDYDATRKDN